MKQLKHQQLASLIAITLTDCISVSNLYVNFSSENWTLKKIINVLILTGLLFFSLVQTSYAGLIGTELSLKTIYQQTPTSPIHTTGFSTTATVVEPGVEFPNIPYDFTGASNLQTAISINIGENFVEIDFENVAPLAMFTPSFNNAYILKFESTTAINIASAEIDETVTTLALASSDVKFVGNELSINAEGLRFNSSSYVRINLVVDTKGTSSKNLGGLSCSIPMANAGNPINTGTGNKFQREVDYIGGTATGLSLSRFYNSQQDVVTIFGANWHSNWHRSITLTNTTTADLTRADGKVISFRKNNSGNWIPDTDVMLSLSEFHENGTQIGWKLVTEDNSSEYYTMLGNMVYVIDKAGNTTTLSYDANQLLTHVTGSFGHKLTFIYDDKKRIVSVTQPDGAIIGYGYDTNNDLISVKYPGDAVRRYKYNEPAYTSSTDLPHSLTGIIDENGNRFASYTYDAQGRATTSEHADGSEKVSITYNTDGSSSITDALGNVHGYNFVTQLDSVKPSEVTGVPVKSMGAKEFSYDANGFIASHTNWNGHVTQYTRDARGLELSRTEASGTPQARTITTAWHPTLRLPTQITEPSGISGTDRVTVFDYDATNGNLLKQTVSAGDTSQTWKYSYNTSGQPTRVTDPNGHVRQFEYDTQGGLAKITNALNQSTSFVNDANGRPVTVTDPNGLVMNIVYTPRGQIASQTIGTETITYHYDKVGNLIQTIYPNGAFLAYTYNQAQQLTRITDAFGDYIEYNLDKMGNRLSSIVYNASNQAIRGFGNSYDAMSRPTKFIGSESQTTALQYDKNGNLIGVTDPLDNEQSKSYDALNRLTQEIDANADKVIYSYDKSNNLTKVTDPLGHSTQYTYNGLGELIQLTSPDTGVTQYSYDANGNKLSNIDARGKQTQYEYDALNRVTTLHRQDGGQITFQYDSEPNAIGRLVTMNDETGTTHWSYDKHGRVIAKTQSFAGEELSKITYNYDETGNLSKMVYPSGYILTYQYDKGRLSQVNVNGLPLVTQIDYTPFGGIASMHYLNGTTYQRSFDTDGRVSQYTALGSRNFSLDYDAAGQITSYLDSEGVVNQSMAYDPVGRIIEANGFFGDESYSYDANGNRLSHKINSDEGQYSYDPDSNRLLSTTINNKKIDRSYDSSGNTTSIGGKKFSFNDMGRMSSGGGSAYYYNGLGQRIYKSSSNSFVSYDESGQIIGEYTYRGSAVNETIYVGNIPVAVGTATGVYFINPDHLNAPRVLTDMNGDFKSFWPFVPFGERGLIAEGKPVNYNARFPGQFYDSETGLHYNGFRDYDPSSGRYIESDPIGLAGQDWNLYQYTGNNPINYTDLKGLSRFDDKKINDFGLYTYLGTALEQTFEGSLPNSFGSIPLNAGKLIGVASAGFTGYNAVIDVHAFACNKNFDTVTDLGASGVGLAGLIYGSPALGVAAASFGLGKTVGEAIFGTKTIGVFFLTSIGFSEDVALQAVADVASAR